MRLDRQFACRTFEGGTTKDRFLEYLREDLLLCLKRDDIVVMNNLRAHHTKGVEELLRSVGAVPLCLPPCSLDFNPIEKMWSRMKAISRKMRVRSQILLDNAVRQSAGLYYGQVQSEAVCGFHVSVSEKRESTL